MRFFYLHSKDVPDGLFHGAQAITVGYERVNIASELEHPPEKLLLSFSRCSKMDTFDKHIAKEICYGRLAKGKGIEIDRPAGTDIYEILTREALKHDKQVEEAYRKRT